MSKDTRKVFMLFVLAGLTGCQGMVPQAQLRQSQLRTYQVYHRGRQIAAQLHDSQMMSQQLAMEKQQAEMHAQQLEQSLATANQRLSNLAAERSQLHDQYKMLLTSLPSPQGPIDSGLARRFEELCRKYPEFEFDPLTGVARFNGELLFATGSNQIRSEGLRVLDDFARIINDGEARMFNVLVVGHTDDVPVVKPQTRALHETNWELSAHRATAVVRQLAQRGVAEQRLGMAGYALHQPTAPNSTDQGRQLNRRVEIFVLPADAAVAGKDAKPIRR